MLLLPLLGAMQSMYICKMYEIRRTIFRSYFILKSERNVYGYISSIAYMTSTLDWIT